MTNLADYDAVFWLTADPPAALASGYADLARELGLPEARLTADANAHVLAVRRWLESPASRRWLLVFDNADEPDVLRNYLPTRMLPGFAYASWSKQGGVLRLTFGNRAGRTVAWSVAPMAGAC